MDTKAKGDKTTIRLPAGLLRRAKAYAAGQGTSLARVIVEALEAFLRRKESRR